jgi:predicted transcriptional regulator
MRSVSPDTVARIRDMKYKEGKTATDIAAILGISPSAVHNYAPTTEVKGADALEVERRLLAGETQAAIIRTLKTDRRERAGRSTHATAACTRAVTRCGTASG